MTPIHLFWTLAGLTGLVGLKALNDAEKQKQTQNPPSEPEPPMPLKSAETEPEKSSKKKKKKSDPKALIPANDPVNVENVDDD